MRTEVLYSAEDAVIDTREPLYSRLPLYRRLITFWLEALFMLMHVDRNSGLAMVRYCSATATGVDTDRKSSMSL